MTESDPREERTAGRSGPIQIFDAARRAALADAAVQEEGPAPSARIAPAASTAPPAVPPVPVVPGGDVWPPIPVPPSPWAAPDWTQAAWAHAAAVPGRTLHGAWLTPPTWAVPLPVATVPRCDLLDEGGGFVWLVELPGVRAQDVALACVGQVLFVSAVRPAPPGPRAFVHSERGGGAVHRRAVALPAPVRATEAQATLRDGVLSVRLPKVHPTDGPTRVHVQG